MDTPLYTYSRGLKQQEPLALCETAKYEVKEVLRESGETAGANSLSEDK